MGNKLFGFDIAAIIAKEIGKGVLSATLIKTTPGTRTPGSLAAGTNPADVPHPCKGFIDMQAVANVADSLASDGSKVIVLLGDTINGGNTVPELGDKITIEGTTYRIPDDGRIDRDAAAATFTCTVRIA